MTALLTLALFASFLCASLAFSELFWGWARRWKPLARLEEWVTGTDLED